MSWIMLAAPWIADRYGSVSAGAPAARVALCCIAGVWPRNVQARRAVQYVGVAGFLLVCVVAYLAYSPPHATPVSPAVPVAPAAATPRGSSAETLSPRRPHLWVLSVGVSQYRDERLRLRYAAADARALAAALRRLEHSPLYDTVHTMVLTDGEATRERILEALESFLGKAGPDDVAVVFLAGHGIRTEKPVAHYFLTASASLTAPHIAGLDMLEMSRQLQRAHRNIARMVVILDTCHGGALADDTEAGVSGADLAQALAPAEGLYILTAARAGEESYELAQVQHGAFTHALLDGLSGQASDPEGFITVLALATHASRLVQQLTRGKQRPYIAMIGEDLVLAGDPARLNQLHSRTLAEFVRPTPGAARARVAIRSFEHLGPDATYDWMRKALSQDIVTAFTEVPQLEVYDESMLRFVTRDSPDLIDAAQRAGIGMLIEGAYWVQDNQLSVSAQVKSVRPLELVASARAQGPVDQFSVLTAELVRGLLDKLSVEVPGGLAARLQQPTGPSLAARRMLAESESGSASADEVPRGAPHSGVAPGASLWRDMLGPALDALARLPLLARPSWAASTGDPEGELRATLEGFRRALESKDLTALQGYYEEFTPGQSAALAQYFANADDLQVEFGDVLVAIIADDAAVSFTRSDQFVDRASGVPQHVTIRVTKRFTRAAHGWVIQREQ
jgi:uncharacterized caspase-like protein